MAGLIEKVARLLCAQAGGEPGSGWQEFALRAEEVLFVLREPSPEMVEGAIDEARRSGIVVTQAQVIGLYRSMIRAALDE